MSKYDSMLLLQFEEKVRREYPEWDDRRTRAAIRALWDTRLVEKQGWLNGTTVTIGDILPNLRRYDPTTSPDYWLEKVPQCGPKTLERLCVIVKAYRLLEY